ncbi:MAG: multidrug transporter [Chloroflexota bacterium]|nr:multidrug transporter [Chloroflexota bacterium]
MPKTGKDSGRARDAGSGQYVKKDYAEKHPKTTVVEHDKSTKKK